jgi:hypothetical protein
MARKVTQQLRRSRRRGVHHLAMTVGSHWAVAVAAHAVATLVLVVATELLHLPTCGR